MWLLLPVWYSFMLSTNSEGEQWRAWNGATRPHDYIERNKPEWYPFTSKHSSPPSHTVSAQFAEFIFSQQSVSPKSCRPERKYWTETTVKHIWKSICGVSTLLFDLFVAIIKHTFTLMYSTSVNYYY